MQLYAVDKPLGLTSHDVVARARRLLGTRKVGHAGTLDPLATGVVLVMAGEATKLSNYLTGHDKTYLAWVTFGATTPTLDSEGPVTRVADASRLTVDAVRGELDRFLSMSSQRPPAFSAVKRAGVRSYAAARRGEAEEPPARPVAYREVVLFGLEPDREELPRSFSLLPGGGPGRYVPDEAGRRFQLPELPSRPDDDRNEAPATTQRTALLRLTVAAGTYVRSFARDIGGALGLPAYLSGLVRTSSGSVDISQAGRLEELPVAGKVSVTEALELPKVVLGPSESADVRLGRRPVLTVPGRVALIDAGGDLVALAEATDEPPGYRLLRVFN